MNTYLLSDVCEKTKTKPGKLQAWMKEEWITPSVQRASGQGSRNIFNDGDIFAIQMLKIMIGMGIPRKFAGEVAREFQKNKIYKLLTDGETKNVGDTSDMAFVEIYVTSDGKINRSALIFNEADLLQARKKTNAAIIYGINLKLIVERAVEISEGIKISESSIVKLSSGK